MFALEMMTHSENWILVNNLGIRIWCLVVVPVNIISPFVGPLLAHLKSRHSGRFWGARFLPSWIYESYLGIVAYALYELAMVFSNTQYTFFFGSVVLIYAALNVGCLHLLILR